MKNKFTPLTSKIAKAILGLTLVTSLTGLYAFKDDFFEISKNIEIFTTLYRDVNINYVDETKPGDLMKTGIDAMLRSLDPYTVYIPESKIEDYRFMTSGQYGGIGATIRKLNDKIYITEPYEGFAADSAGLKAGDEIIAIDDVKIAGKSTEEVSSMLKGQSATKINLIYIPLGETSPKKTSFVRQNVKVKDVPFSGILKEDIGYIKLDGFTATASAEVKKAFLDLKEKGMQKLIFDLRGNGGGLLREAVNIVNFFIPKGKMVVDTRGRLQEWKTKKYSAVNKPLDLEIPIVILVDGMSASASEIVSGALQDYDRAVLVGSRTYGKGLVQQTLDIYFNAKLKVTVAKYYVPSGRCIQKIDYSHRDENGIVTEVPDSLLKTFKTEGGRKVIDGRGIEPDILIADERPGAIIGGLYGKGMFFKYANQYVLKNKTITSASKFHLDDEEYNAFVALAKKEELKYSTQTESFLKRFKKIAEDENYLQFAEEEFESLKEKIMPDQEKDLLRFKNQIKIILENEIVSRYYKQSGRVESLLIDDPTVEKGFEYLSTSKQTEILKPAN